MNQVLEFVEKLTKDMDDTTWYIGGTTDFTKVTDEDGTRAELPDGSEFEQQDDHFLTQTCHGEDSYTGTVIYPVTDNKAVIIHYMC